MSEKIMKVVKSDHTPELIGLTYIVEVTNSGINNLQNVFGDLKTSVLIARVYYPSRLRSGYVVIDGIEYNIVNSINVQAGTTWYLQEYRRYDG